MSREFSQVGVVGLGTMGAGITEVLARAGVAVVAVERDGASLEQGKARLERSARRAAERGKLEGITADELIANVTFSTSLSSLADADLVIEAVEESLESKEDVFAQLDGICKDEAILATNTSSLSVTKLGVGTGRPGRVIGLHFFNPAPVMKFVEIVRSVVTEADVVTDIEGFMAKLGKTTVTVGDRAGFIANALLFGYLNHAVRMYESRYASREDIDAAMKLGCGLPMGPLAVLDLIGLDTSAQILESIYAQTKDRLFAPAPIFKQMIAAGLTGRKSGRGFYTYAAPGESAVVADALTPAAGGAAAGARQIGKVGVVGSGTMATGIIEVFAKAGFDVLFVARSDEKVAGVTAALTKSLDKAVQRGKLSEDKRNEVLGRVRGTSTVADLSDVELVVEAVVEDIDVKRALFTTLDEVCKPGTVLATTTSSLPVIEVAAATSRPNDVIGMHFFNPAAIMRLVEVVSTVTTDAEIEATVLDVTAKIGKHAVRCGDRAGFIVNALLFPYLNDAVRMLEGHYATADEIDTAMTAGCGYPMGPFALLDVVGNDVSLAIQRTLFNEFREPGWAPAPLLEHIVTAGRLGRKTGKGFRDYK